MKASLDYFFLDFLKDILGILIMTNMINDIQEFENFGC